MKNLRARAGPSFPLSFNFFISQRFQLEFIVRLPYCPLLAYHYSWPAVLSSRKIIVLTKEPSNGPADHVINRPLMITPIQWNHFYRFLITVALHSSPRDDASQGKLKFHFKFSKIKISLDVYVPLQRHNVTGLRGEMWFWVVSGGPDHSGHLSVPSAVFAHRSPGSEELGGGWPAGKPIPLRFHHRPTTISLDCLFVLGRYPLSSLSSCFISSNLSAGCTLQLKFN